MPAGVFENEIPLKDLDRMDMIAETQAEDAKFYNALQKGKGLEQLTYNWQIQSRDRVGHEGAKDGEDQEEFDSQDRVDAKARSMEIRAPWKVSQKTDYTKQIGGPEKKRQKALASLKLREKVQGRFLSDAEPVQGSKIIADETAGVFWWLLDATSTFYTLPAAFRVNSGCTFTGAIADLHEETFEGMLAQGFKDRNGGDLMLDGWVGIDLKNRVNKFSVHDTESNGADNLRVFNFKGDSKKILRCVDFLEMSEGLIRLHPTTYLLRDKVTGLSHADAHRSGVFLDMKKWWVRFNKTWTHTDLPNGGGGPRGFWYCSTMLQPVTLTGQLCIRCNG